MFISLMHYFKVLLIFFKFYLHLAPVVQQFCPSIVWIQIPLMI